MSKLQLSAEGNQYETGFTLLEMIISMVLGLVISSAVIQVMISNTISEKLNRAMSSTQESGRFIVNRLRNEILMAGMYDDLNPALNLDVDSVNESHFVKNHPVILPSDFAANAQLGSTQGKNGNTDVLVVSLQATMDCRAYSLGYENEEHFYVVNEYFVTDNKLKCRGYDGRYLLGQKPAEGHNRHRAITIADGVVNFQVMYGVTKFNSVKGGPTSFRFITADAIDAARHKGMRIVSLRIAFVVKADNDFTVEKRPSFKLLNENIYIPPDKGLYKLFETTIALRNTKNVARNIL